MNVAVRVRQVGRPRRLAVNVRGTANLVGTLVKYLGLAPLLPTALALGYGESPWPFVFTVLIVCGVGWGLEHATRGEHRVGAREGFLVVSVTWLAAAAVGALPYLLSGDPQFDRPLDAYFEAMSGFTTTGATVVTDFDGLTQSLAMWRQFTQWLGGMGIIVLALAVLPRLRVGGRQLLESELPGPEIETLATRIRETAQRLWALYIALTVAAFAILAVFALTDVDPRMTVFDAAAHAFTTLPTGGFSTQPRSVEAYAAATQWVIVLFMVLAGMNFALMYRAFVQRQPRVFARDDELPVYLAVLMLGSVILAAELLSEDVAAGEAAVRHAVFQAVSIMTTTGYASTDFNTWPVLATMTIVGLMFVGGSAGSTSGGVKVVRHVLVGRILRRELDQTVHPEVVVPVRLNRTVVDERTLRAVAAFILLYIGIFVVGAALLALDAARTGVELAPLDAVAVAATCLANNGPGLGFAGPMGSFEPFSDLSTALLVVLMWLGRLEIIPILVLFTRHYWRSV